jgi:hypothetical protein
MPAYLRIAMAVCEIYWKVACFSSNEPITCRLSWVNDYSRRSPLVKNGKTGGLKIMNIYKKKDKLVIELDLYQNSYDAADELIGKVSNLVGIICGDEQGFAQVIDMGYKGSFDYGEIIVKTYFPEKEFVKLCNDLGIVTYKYPVCAECGKVMYGCFTMNDKGFVHEKCNEENNN